MSFTYRAGNLYAKIAKNIQSLLSSGQMKSRVEPALYKYTTMLIALHQVDFYLKADMRILLIFLCIFTKCCALFFLERLPYALVINTT